MQLIMSPLPKTWIFDLDGTIVEHNGYKHGEDILLPGVLDFWKQIPESDFILILTSRTCDTKYDTEKFLRDNQIRFNQIIFNMPMGERILINDDKPSGLPMSISIRRERNEGLQDLNIRIDESM